MSSQLRLSSGIAGLDERLGGGFIPGTLTVVVGATGIGKSQLGLHFLDAGLRQERRRGVVFDMSARGDSQGHADYAQRLFDWSLVTRPSGPFSPERYFDENRPSGDYLHIFDGTGRRVARGDLDFDLWHDWQVELAAKLETAIDFLYRNFVRGARRVVVDGIEPAERPSESIQFELFEYVYHQILRKDCGWVARDLFRQSYRANAELIERHAYDCHDIAAMLLSTSHETMLERLVERPLVDGDLLATANTLIYMGKIRARDSAKLDRGLFIAKHRGSACSDEIVRFTIDQRGIELGNAPPGA